MDTVQLTLLITGVCITLIPLDWVQFTFVSKDMPVSIWTLFIPMIGIGMMAISLLSYHKDSLRTIFYSVCNTLDQTGLGVGVVSNLVGKSSGQDSGLMPLSSDSA